jgi:hypothetical protein
MEQVWGCLKRSITGVKFFSLSFVAMYAKQFKYEEIENRMNYDKRNKNKTGSKMKDTWSKKAKVK